MSERTKRLRLVAPVLCWTAVIFGLSSIPGADIPSPPIPSADKLVHLGLYGILGYLGFRLIGAWSSGAPSRRGGTWGTWGLTVLAVLAYGVSDELHQAFVPRRSPDVMDVLADLAGGALGAGLAAAVATRERRRGSGKDGTRSDAKPSPTPSPPRPGPAAE